MSYINPLKKTSFYPEYNNLQAMRNISGQNASNITNAKSNNTANAYSYALSSMQNQAISPYSVMGSMASQLFSSLSNIQYTDIVNSIMNPFYGMFSGPGSVDAINNNQPQDDKIADRNARNVDHQGRPGQATHHHHEGHQMDGKIDGSNSDSAKTGQKAGSSQGGSSSDSNSASAEINGITIYSGQTITLDNGATATFDGQTLTVTTADGNTITNDTTPGEYLDIQVNTKTGSTSPDGNSQDKTSGSSFRPGYMPEMSSGVNSANNQNVNNQSVQKPNGYNPFI